MSADFSAILWKEWREIVVQRSTGGIEKFRPLVPVALIGVFVPLRLGASFFNPLTLAALIFAALIGVVVVSAETFAGERERHTLETLLASRLSDRAILFGKIAAAISYDWLLTMVSILIGTITVNLTNWEGRFLFVDNAASWLILVLGPPLLGGVVASAGVLVSLRTATVQQAVQALMTGFMLVPFALFFGFRAAPAAWKAGFLEMFSSWTPIDLTLVVMAVLVVVNLVLMLTAMARFQRTKLVLD